MNYLSESEPKQLWNQGVVFDSYQGQLNSDTVLDLDDNLSPHLHTIPGRTFILNGATYQWTQECKDWYEAAGLVSLKLPPHSPEFNAIERCWGWLKRKVRAQAPANQAQLQQAVQTAFGQIIPAIVRGFIREVRDNIRNYH